jgi:SOS response regulatory protein OraA/RecX
MAGFLARRGFNYGVAAPVVQKVWEEKNSPDEIGTLDHSDQTY